MTIFLSYRREDSQAITGRIDDHLRAAFGERDVYRDIDSIPPGVDFVEHLEAALRGCDVCLAIIGNRWASGYIGRENDFVRLELEAALALRVAIIPVLVDGASFPKERDIPQSLHPLLRRQATRVDSGADFKAHVNRLAQSIRRIRQGQRIGAPENAASQTPSGHKALLFGGSGAAFVGVVAAFALLLVGGFIAFVRFPGARSATSGAAATTPSAVSSAPVASTPAPSAGGAGRVCPFGMVSVPGGSFFMGSDEGLPLEKPAHQVTIAPYCIDEFEVTVKKYKACSDVGRCKPAGTVNDWPNISDKERRAFDPLCNVRDPAGHATHPINCVDWEMADKFCREQAGRLPTEAEWEFAARGPDGRKYPWGNDDPGAGYLNACGSECVAWGTKNLIDEKAMYDADDGFPNTAPVGSFPKGASRYGVQDVVGNVWEWVADFYAPYGHDDEQKNPTGPKSGDERVIRGGAWNGSYSSWVRPTFRYHDVSTKRSYGIGFRCAK